MSVPRSFGQGVDLKNTLLHSVVSHRANTLISRPFRGTCLPWQLDHVMFYSLHSDAYVRVPRNYKRDGQWRAFHFLLKCNEAGYPLGSHCLGRTILQATMTPAIGRVVLRNAGGGRREELGSPRASRVPKQRAPYCGGHRSL